MPVYKYIDLFLTHLAEEKLFSSNTCVAYQRDIRDFMTFWQEFQEISNPTLESFIKLELRIFRSWLTHRLRKGLSPSSTSRAISSLRSFNTYLLQQNLPHNTDLPDLRSPKKPKRLPRPLATSDSFSLLELCRQQSEPWLALRDYALCSLLWGCGLRIGEALSLCSKDILASTDSITITGKGKKQRQIPLLPHVKSAIMAYIEASPHTILENQPLFRQVRGGEMKPREAQKRIQSYRRAMNLPENVTPHALRHSFASDLLQNGGDLRTIQELLGHQSLSSTQHYAQVDRATLAKVYQQHLEAKNSS